jgi:hypothetical protein
MKHIFPGEAPIRKTLSNFTFKLIVSFVKLVLIDIEF